MVLNDEPADAPGASDLVVDTLRQLLTALGALLGSPAGLAAVSDAAACRSLPAISKALRRLWFDTPLSAAWDSKEEAVWVCHLLAVSDGARAGILSFYGAGIIACNVLVDFARSALEENGLPLDEAWIGGVLAVERVLRGRHFEQLQKWPADRRCGGGRTDLFCASRLPCQMRRTLDLEGKQLTKLQAAGLGAAFMIPGSMTVGFGVIGVGLLYKKARQLISGEDEFRESDPWMQTQAECMQKAHSLLRRKQCPIEVRYVSGAGEHGLEQVRVCLYSMADPLGILPAGGFNKESSSLLEAGQRCALRPKSEANSFKLRVFKPSMVDMAISDSLNDGVEVRRGDQIAIIIHLTALGEIRLRFMADRRSSGAASDSSNSPVRQDGGPALSLVQEDLLERSREEEQEQHVPPVITATDAADNDVFCFQTMQSDALDPDGESGAASSGSPVQENHQSAGYAAADSDLAEFWALAAKLEKKSPPVLRLSA